MGPFAQRLDNILPANVRNKLKVTDLDWADRQPATAYWCSNETIEARIEQLCELADKFGFEMAIACDAWSMFAMKKIVTRPYKSPARPELFPLKCLTFAGCSHISATNVPMATYCKCQWLHPAKCFQNA
jgi:hypothetical protein